MSKLLSDRNFDVIVVGAGAMGSATAWHLARRGHKVLVFDRFTPPHARSSSHGSTRLVRQAYFEHPDYVPLLKRAYQHWAELGALSGKPLFEKTGLWLFAPPDSLISKGVRQSAKLHNLDVEIDETPKLNPFEVPPGFHLHREDNAGFVWVDDTISTHLTLAQNQGAVLRTNEPVLDWSSNAGSVEVETSSGRWHASQLVLAPGPWISKLLKLSKLTFDVQRVPLFWFQSPRLMEKSTGFPCFAFDTSKGFFYGFPGLQGEGLKIAIHRGCGRVDDPEIPDREIGCDDIEPVQWFLKNFVPTVRPEPIRSAVCMYTMVRDEHFVIDRHPAFDRATIVSACSGHGFKFCPVIGEITADLAEFGTTKLPIGLFKLNRPTLYP
jgi:sarcosine oxidase